MNRPLPPIHDTPAARTALLSAAHEAPSPPRVPAFSLLPTPQARTRRQLAPRLGGSREPVGRWLAA
jgi:hypothetical protein